MVDKLNKQAFAIAFAAIEMFFVAVSWVVGLLSPSSELIGLMQSFYIGFDTSVVGLLIGLAEAFVLGWIVGYFVALIYNKVVQ